MSLRFVQKFGEGCNITGMMCDEECSSRAIALWADEQNKAYALCEKHRKERVAPLPPVGIEYAQTMCLMDRFHLVNGKPEFDPRLKSKFKSR